MRRSNIGEKNEKVIDYCFRYLLSNMRAIAFLSYNTLNCD